MTTAQKRAITNYRSRLAEKGMSRFEVLGRDKDRDLIRRLARFLTENPSHADEVHQTLDAVIEESRRGNIYTSLRRSPLVGVDLDTSRPAGSDREIEF